MWLTRSINPAESLTRQVKLSAGFIDLVNDISHAKAIDHVQPGFFDQYIREPPSWPAPATPPLSPPNIVEPRFWTEDILNDQMSFFNQTVGLIEAINLAHHYLGHYASRAPKSPSRTAKSFPSITI